jgi:hypothetical protein
MNGRPVGGRFLAQTPQKTTEFSFAKIAKKCCGPHHFGYYLDTGFLPPWGACGG